MVDLVRQAPRLFAEAPVPYLSPAAQESRCDLTRAQVACLLAMAFFGLVPSQPDKDNQPQTAAVDFGALLFPKAGLEMPPYTQKLRCFLHYFHTVACQLQALESAADEPVTCMRWSSPAPDGDWLANSHVRMCPLSVQPLKTSISDNSSCLLHADFANASVGGGVLGVGTMQEEITFATHPELCVAKLVCAPLGDGEACVIGGCRRFCSSTGYSDSFHFQEGVAASAGEEPAQLLQRQPAIQVAIDAKMYPSDCDRPFCHDHAHQVEDASRDLLKARCGFQAALSLSLANTTHPNTALATGNWGSGAYGGSAAVKLFIQWVAASHAGLGRIEYHPWDDEALHDHLSDAAVMGRYHSATISQVWSAVKGAVARQKDLPHPHRFQDDGQEFLSAVNELLSP